MAVDLHLLADLPAEADVAVRAAFSDRLDAAAVPGSVLRALNFEGKADQLQVVPLDGALILLVGLGALSDVAPAGLRKAGAQITRAAKKHPRVAVGVLADLLAARGAAAEPAVSDLAVSDPADAVESDVAGPTESDRAGGAGPSPAADAEAGSAAAPEGGGAAPIEPIAAEVSSLEAQALVEGLLLAAYEFNEHKSEPSKTKLAELDVVVPSDDARAGVERGRVLAESVIIARDLVNEPGGSLTPPKLAKQARKLGRAHNFSVKVFTRKDIVELGLGGLLGVNRGSDQPPRFVELRYKPAGESRGLLALVGKGITFDSGGLSLKTATGMMTMKCDMAGAAAVLGAFAAIARLRPAVEVRGYLPMTDNMTGGDATRPGDVFTIRNGKTIEVLNTDAEGRLILADALCLAAEAQPDAIVDLATLTGACVTALGAKLAGLMGRNDRWLEQVEAAAANTGEQVWRLPMPAEYRKQYESNVADMKNIGSGQGGALVAGLILGEFVPDHIAWAHLDIAGPAFTESDDAEVTKGASGYGVRLLVELAERFEKPASA